MATLDERVGKLETRVSTLETWSGPGQAETLLQGQRGLRREVRELGRRLGRVERVQEQHTQLLMELKSDVTGLKGDVKELKGDVAGLKAATWRSSRQGCGRYCDGCRRPAEPRLRARSGCAGRRW